MSVPSRSRNTAEFTRAKFLGKGAGREGKNIAGPRRGHRTKKCVVRSPSPVSSPPGEDVLCHVSRAHSVILLNPANGCSRKNVSNAEGVRPLGACRGMPAKRKGGLGRPFLNGLFRSGAVLWQRLDDVELVRVGADGVREAERAAAERLRAHRRPL